MESDEALYARVKRGDMRAFDELYARYEGKLFGFLLGQLRNRADAEDAFHEAFLSTLKSREVTFVGGAGFKTWLYRIARNNTLNRLRSSARGARAYAQLEAPESEPAADAAMEKRELLEALDLAVAQLPPALSELYHLRSSGLSYEEMAGVLEIPLGTLKSRMNQMMCVLREEMKPWTAR